MRPPNIRSIVCLLATTLVVALASAGLATAQSDTNRGTIKIHDGPVADPETRNEPHVTCDFYVQGFNMNDPDGFITFFSWPPTGDKSEIVPTGDTLTWTGTPDGDGEFDFLKGAYYLPDGHYRVEVYTNDDHPGHNAGHFAKAKMFWVDPCEDEEVPPPPCVDDRTTPGDDCNPTPCVDDPDTTTDECDEQPPCEDVPATEIDECDETEIPFFPGFTALALGSLGALGAAGYMIRRRS